MNEDGQGPEPTITQPAPPKQGAYLRSNLTIKTRRTPATFLCFSLLFFSLLLAFATVNAFQTKGAPSSNPSLAWWAVPLGLFYLTFTFFKGWIKNTHTIQLHENAITAIALRGRKTVEFGPAVRCGLYKVAPSLWTLYFLAPDQVAYGGTLRANTAADRGVLVQLVNALHSRGVVLEGFPRLNCEFIVQYNALVPEWQPLLASSLGEEKHRFKLFGRRPAKAASAQFALGSRGVGLVSEKGVLEAYAFSEMGSFTVEFSTQKKVTVAKIDMVFLNRFVWKEEIEVADEVGKNLLIDACEAVKAMNAPPPDPSSEESPQQSESVEKEEADAAGSGEGSPQ